MCIVMSELLFECYGVPSVTYGVDSLFSLYHNHPSPGESTTDLQLSMKLILADTETFVS